MNSKAEVSQPVINIIFLVPASIRHGNKEVLTVTK